MDPLTDRNKELADFLDLLSSYYIMAKEAYRAKTFSNASTQIREYPTAIVSGAQARRELNRIGDSTEIEIDSFLRTGTSPRLQELEARFADRKSTIDYFRSFYGIGPVKAVDYYNQGFRTWEDLWLKAPLTVATRIAIYWQNHLNLRIERSEMDLINLRIGSILDPYNIKWTIAGSYRRGETSSGDIDILVESRPDLDMSGMAYLLKDLIPTVNINGVEQPSILAQGPVLMMGILRLNDQYKAQGSPQEYKAKGSPQEYKAHRFDVKFINSLSYTYALMHFTGSKEFNVIMRQKALDLGPGFTLNEYILYQKIGTVYHLYPAETEREIFEYLGVQYLEPFQRTRGLTHLAPGPQRISMEVIVDITQPITDPRMSELIERLERIR